MIKREKLPLNRLFNRHAIAACRDDDRWVLPNEYIGVELETEDYQAPRTQAAVVERDRWWHVEPEGSLINGTEWVLSRPLYGEDLTKAIDALFTNLKFTSSERTSTHIHINMSDNIDLEQFRAFFILNYIVDPAVFRLGDEARKWCSYCQPLSDMHMSRVLRILNSDNVMDITSAVKGSIHEDRYYGFNVASFAKHGTIEYRHFPATNNKEVIISWIQLIMSLKLASRTLPTPAAMLDAMGDTPEQFNAFLNKYVQSHAHDLYRLLDIREVLYRIRYMKAIISVEPSNAAIGRGAVKPQLKPSALYKSYLKKTYKVDLEEAPKPAPANAVGGQFAELLNNEEVRNNPELLEELNKLALLGIRQRGDA